MESSKGVLYPVPRSAISWFSPHDRALLSAARNPCALEDVMKDDKQILLVAQKDAALDDPKPEDIHSVGTIGTVLQLLKLPDGTAKVLVEGSTRARITGFGWK